MLLNPGEQIIGDHNIPFPLRKRGSHFLDIIHLPALRRVAAIAEFL
jgi:hypothetical protein